MEDDHTILTGNIQVENSKFCQNYETLLKSFVTISALSSLIVTPLVLSVGQASTETKKGIVLAIASNKKTVLNKK